MTNLATLKQAAIDAAARFTAASDEFVQAEQAYNAALRKSNPTAINLVDKNRPLQFSNAGYTETDC